MTPAYRTVIAIGLDDCVKVLRGEGYDVIIGLSDGTTMTGAENLVCPWPDCNVPADRCQVHHIHPHNLGGHTKPTNLTMLCKYHNGVNDDNPNAPPRNGRVHREGGRVRYRSPGGRELENTHVNSSLGAFDLI